MQEKVHDNQTQTVQKNQEQTAQKTQTKQIQSVKKNFIMNIFLTMSSYIFPLLTVPYVSRILLPEGTGRVSFVQSMVTYFALFAQLGIPTYGVRTCAKLRDDKEKLSRTVHELFFLNLLATMVMYLVMILAVMRIPRLQTEKQLFLVMGPLLLLNAIGMEYLYKGLEQYTYITIRSVVFKFIGVIAMFLLIHEKSDYVIYGGITIFASSASMILNFFHAHRYIQVKWLGEYRLTRHLKVIFIFFAMSCATTIYTNIDTVMLGFMTTDQDVGFYNAAVKVKHILLSLVTSLGTVLLPRVSYYVERGLREEFRKITRKALNFAVLLAIPLSLYFIVFAQESIYLLSGEAYAGSILPMQIIMPTLWLIGMTNVMGIQILLPLGKEKIVLYSEIAGAVVDLLINALLIPKMASAGAAIGTLVAEMVVWIVQYMALRQVIAVAYRSIRWRMIFLATGIAFALSFWVKWLPWSAGTSLEMKSFVALAISAVLFFGSYGLVLLVAKEPLVWDMRNQVVGWIQKRRRG